MSTVNTSSQNPFAFLLDDSPLPVTVDTEVVLPTSGNGIYGMVAEWTPRVLYRWWHADMVSVEDLSKANGNFLFTQDFDTGSFYFFTSMESANAVGKLVGQKYDANPVWHWQTPVSDILNLNEERKAKFGEVLSYDVSVVSLMIKKSRHEFHMITLPSYIQALATRAGFIKEPVFDYESLRVDNAAIDDAYQTEVIGTDTSYESSTLWHARAKLWAALGESDPRRYTVSQGQRTDTTAIKLAKSLLTIYRHMPVVARLVTVPNPRVDAVTKKLDEDGNPRRLTIPVVAQIWQSKEDCISDLELDAGAECAPAAVSLNGAPPIPSAWREYPQNWREYVVEITTSIGNLPKPILLAKLTEQAESLRNNYQAEPEDFAAWAEWIATQGK